MYHYDDRQKGRGTGREREGELAIRMGHGGEGLSLFVHFYFVASCFKRSTSCSSKNRSKQTNKKPSRLKYKCITPKVQTS